MCSPVAVVCHHFISARCWGSGGSDLDKQTCGLAGRRRFSVEVLVWLKEEEKVCVEWLKSPPAAMLMRFHSHIQTGHIRLNGYLLHLMSPWAIYMNSQLHVTNTDDFSAGLVWTTDKSNLLWGANIRFSGIKSISSLFCLTSFIHSLSNSFTFICPAQTFSSTCMLWARAGICQYRCTFRHEAVWDGRGSGSGVKWCNLKTTTKPQCDLCSADSLKYLRVDVYQHWNFTCSRFPQPTVFREQ